MAADPTDPEHKYEMLEWSDQKLVYRLQRNETPAPVYVQAELQRRELVASSELKASLDASKRSADRASRWLIILTVVLHCCSRLVRSISASGFCVGYPVFG